MYDKILCIYPIDQTIDFLVPIPDKLQKIFEDKFEMVRIDSEEDSYLKAIYKMETCSVNTLIVFIGHGSNAGFHCYDKLKNENLVFLNAQNIKRIQKKNIFAFACNSSIFLKKFSSDTNSWIGFDDLPTEKETFPIEFNDDNEKVRLLDLYKTILIDAILFSLIELINTGSILKSFSSLKLFLNKFMIKFASNKSNEYNKKVAELIFNTKKGLDFYEFFNY